MDKGPVGGPVPKNHTIATITITYDQGYDNMLLGQGYRTPNAAVINGGMMIGRRKSKNSEKHLLHCHFVYHESYLKSPRNEAGAPRREASF
jgi:hypothetical protein